MKFQHFKFVFTLFLSIFLLAACSSNKEETVVKDFYSALSAGDTSKAVSMIDFSSVPEKDRALASNKFMALLGEMKIRDFDPHNGIKSVDITNKQPSSDGNSVSMTVTLTYGDGTTKTTNMTVVKVNNEWKISMQ